MLNSFEPISSLNGNEISTVFDCKYKCLIYQRIYTLLTYLVHGIIYIRQQNNISVSQVYSSSAKRLSNMQFLFPNTMLIFQKAFYAISIHLWISATFPVVCYVIFKKYSIRRLELENFQKN